MTDLRLLNKLKQRKIISIIAVIIIILLSGNGCKSVKSTNNIKTAVESSNIGKYVKTYETSGYLNSTISITANDEFARLSNDEILTVMNSVYDKVLGAVSKNAVENNVEVSGEKLLADRIIYVKTSIGEYSFDYNGLKLPNGTLYTKKNTDITTNDTTTYTNTDTSNTYTDVYSTPQEPSDNDKAFAWTAAKAVVKDNLKAPSTAKFPFSYGNEYIKEISYNTFLVKSYVDAENSFGAKIRNNFSVTIIKKGKDNYTYKDLKINE